MRQRSIHRVTGCIPLSLVLALAGCGGGGVQNIAAEPNGGALQVAAGEGGASDKEIFTVNANEARTSVGRYKAGDRIQISVLGASWSAEPGPRLYDTFGIPGQPCLSDPEHPCIGGSSPLLGLILLTAMTVPEEANEDSPCMAVQRLHIPNGAEFTVPVDAEIALGPNDWEDGLSNNAGILLVEVERAASKKAAATERKVVTVGAYSPSTLAGRFRAGEYVRFTVKDGTWNNDPGSPMVGAAGYPDKTCGEPGHVCTGGEGKPLMGLILMMSCFSITEKMMPLQRIERAFIPQGTTLVLEHDAELFLAPNDRSDDLQNNRGSARVRVRKLSP